MVLASKSSGIIGHEKPLNLNTPLISLGISIPGVLLLVGNQSITNTKGE